MDKETWSKLNVGIWALNWLLVLPILTAVWCYTLPFDYADEVLGFWIASWLILIPLIIGHFFVSLMVLMKTKRWVALASQIGLLIPSLAIYAYFMSQVFYG